MVRKITIHIDGACSGKSLYGGWAVIVTDGDDKAVIHGGEPRTTNNRMELTAFLEALSIVDALKGQVEIVGDSEYAIKNYKQYLDGWERANWRKSDGKPIKNADLWKKVMTVRRSLKSHPLISQVIGHSGVEGNEEADEYAVKARVRSEDAGAPFREKLRIRPGKGAEVVTEAASKPAPKEAQAPAAKESSRSEDRPTQTDNRGGFLAFRIMADRYRKSEIGIEEFYAEVRNNAADIF